MRQNGTRPISTLKDMTRPKGTLLLIFIVCKLGYPNELQITMTIAVIQVAIPPDKVNIECVLVKESMDSNIDFVRFSLGGCISFFLYPSNMKC